MASPYTRLLASVTVSGGPDDVELLTPAAGYATVLRDVLVVPDGTAAGTLLIYRLTGSGIRPLIQQELQLGTQFHLELRQVLPVGLLVIAHYTGTTAHISLTGYLLSDP